MPSLKKILFPVDFSEQCRRVAPFAASLSRHFEAQLTVLHSIGILPNPRERFAGLAEPFMEELRKSSHHSMEAFVRQEFVSHPVQSVILEGDPAQLIVDYARKQGMELIMMPTHGYGPFRRFLIGSITARVLHDAQCPVWTSAHAEGAAPPSRGYRKVLCAADRGSSSVPLMQWAAWFAGRYEAVLKIVHVIPAVDETSSNPGEAEVRRFLFSERQEEFAGRLLEAGLQVELRLRGGDIAGRMAETALQERADLLVVGRGHIQRALGGLRTHSLAIIREAPCPVISL
jgi:nucleotide-binding universal stress UspA family protein